MDESKFKREYLLIANSPLLHFQYRENGATIRATEVKSKLDRFLMKKLGMENIPKEWFLEDRGALDYKMRFVVSDQVSIEKPPSIFYGNINKLPSDLGYVKAITADCTMTVLCFHEELLAKIDEYVSEFFICTNFARMQSKGFGSFVVEGADLASSHVGKMLCENTGSLCCYSFSAGRNVFDTINNVYSDMKREFKPEKRKRNGYLATTYEDEGMQVIMTPIDPEKQRVRSPIFFKIIGNTVYMTAKVKNGAVFGYRVEIRDETENKEVDIDHFMKWFVEQYNQSKKETGQPFGLIKTVYTAKGGNKNG